MYILKYMLICAKGGDKMSLYSESFTDELIRDIFRTHPMWNYNFYIIIESDHIENFEPIGIGFKNIKILNKSGNEFVNINDNGILNINYNQKCNCEITCENGMTHDGSIHKFVDDINSGIISKFNILVMQIEKNEGEFKDRIEKASITITSVKRTWLVEDSTLSSLEMSGFDAMSNEIFIQKIKFMADCVKIMEMPEEIAREKAKAAVSKLF